MDQQKEKLNKDAASDITEGFLYALSNFNISGYYVDLKNEKAFAVGQLAEYRDRYGTETDTSGMDAYIRECVHEDDQALMAEVTRFDYIRERLRKEKSYSVEIRDHGTGEERWYRFTVMRGADEDHAAAMFTDVTDQVLQRRELEKAESGREEALEAFEAIHDAIGSANWRMTFDESGKMTGCVWSDRFRRMLGYYSEEDFPNALSSWTELLHPADKEMVLDAYWAAVNDRTGKTVYSVEYRLLTRIGGYRWYSAHGSLSRYADGTPKIFYGIFLDVNDQVLSAQNREAQLEEISALNSHMQEELRINAALSQEYTGVFMINCDDGSMKVLKLDGDQNAANMISPDLSYDDFRRKYLLRFALPEYSADVLRLSELPNLIRYFKDGHKDLLVKYRTKPNPAGQSNFELYVVPFLNGDNNQIIFGCRCIDAVVSKEEETRDIIGCLGKAYFCLYYIDLSSGEYREIENPSLGVVSRTIEHQGKAGEAFLNMSKNLVAPEQAEEILRFTDISTLPQRLQDQVSVGIHFFGPHVGWCEGIFVCAKRNDAGACTHAIWGVRSIRQEKEKEAEYNRKLQEANDCIANAGYGMWHILLKDGAEPRMQVNDKMAELLGIAGQNLSEEELYHAWYDRIVPEAIPSVQKSVGEMLAGSFSENTYQWVHPAKGTIYVRCGGTAGTLEDGTDVLSGYHADVTDIVYEEEQKKAELRSAYDRLAKSTAELEKQYRITASLASDYSNIFIIDTLERTIRTVSLRQDTRDLLSIEKQATYPYDLLLDRYISASRIYPADAAAMTENMRLDHVMEQLKEKEEFSGNYRITEAGRVHYFKFTYRTVAGTQYVLLGFQNIDKMMEAEIRRNRELEEAKEAAEKANKAKTAFLFNMSHDIRTPMNAIIGFADLLEKHKNEPEKVDDYIQKLQSSSGLLLSLINSVLEMARIESGKEKLDETVCGTGVVTREIISVFEDQMRQKNISFTSNVAISTPYMLCDQPKLREICLNILSNAVKYTPNGGSIHVEMLELPCERPGYATIRGICADTGIGMSKEFLPHLFEEFTREQTATESRQQGTGLGMPIVKKLIDLMGGTIEVESELGKGTTFTVTIDLKIADSPLNAKPESRELRDAADRTDFAGRRILLAEDNDLNAEIAMEILSEVGFEVERAADGIICVDMLQKAANGYYDVILMDIQMPNMDGYKATRVIRSMDDSSRSQIPIIAMTANAFDEDRKNALASGMNGHLAKPIDVDELMRTLAGLLG